MTPVVETPEEEIPVVEAPAEETPVVKAPEEETPSKIINIEIQYVKADADQTVLAQPYKATIPLGYSQTETIPLPAVAGFTAKATKPESVEGLTLAESNYLLDFSKFTEDTTVQIIYEPNEVDYTVEHLFQNLEQTDYVTNPAEKETKQAKVGDTVTAEAKTFDGFSPVQPMQSETIPVKGELNLQVKYNRNEYTITYNTDGGSYLPMETKLFESQLVKPENPTKKGYTFVKWEDESGQEFDFTDKTMPAKDMILKAVWTEGKQTPYRLAYYVQNTDGEGYTPVAFVTKEGKTGDPVTLPSEEEQDFLIKYQFPGMEYWDDLIPKWKTKYNMTEEDIKKSLVKKYFDKGYFYNEVKSTDANKDTVIAGDGSTVASLYFDRRVYTLIVGDNPDFYDEHSTTKNVKIVKDNVVYDTKDKLYKFPVRFGQDFSDKMLKPENIPDLKNDQFIKGYIILGNDDDYDWLGNKPPYILDFKMARIIPWTGIGAQGDENSPRVLWLSMEVGDNKKELKVVEHFQDVDGKYADSGSIQTSTIPLSYEDWFYDVEHEGFTQDQSYMTGVKRAIRSYEDGILKISYRPNTTWVFLIKRNTDNPAKPNKYDKIVTIDSNGNEVEGEPESKGYDQTSDGEVHAYYKRNQYELRLHYDYVESPNPETKKVYFEATVSDQLPDATTIATLKPKNIPEEYEFQGWYRDPHFSEKQKLQDSLKMPASPLDLYAKWGQPTGDKTVTIDPDNGQAVNPITVAYGKPLDKTKVGTPTKAGYDFVAWRAEGSQDNYDFNRPVTQDFTLKAIWTKKHLASLTISYINDEDNTEASETKIVKNLVVDTDYSYNAPNLEGKWPDELIKKIRIQADDAKNVLTFRYKPFTKATYTIRYITRVLKDGQEVETEIKESGEVTTDKNIDTRNYEKIEGYEPITLQQTIRLAWNQKNEMTFVYKKSDSNEAGYRIEYYFDQDGTGKYVLDEARSKDYSGKVGTTMTLSEEQMPIVLDGYVLNKNKSNSTGTITTQPKLILKIYYGPVMITYDLNGGILDGKTGSVQEAHKIGDVISLRQAPTRSGYKFSYWEGSRYNPGDRYEVKGDHTFKAIWIPISTDNGNSGKPSWFILNRDQVKPVNPTLLKPGTSQKQYVTLPRTGEKTGTATAVTAILLLLAGALLIRRRK